MKPYFEKMKEFGSVLPAGKIKSGEANVKLIKEVEAGMSEAVAKVKNAGMPESVINKRGQLTVWQRLDYLVDAGTWCPLNTLYNPHGNEEGTNNVVNGLAKISGKWAVVIGFDNKVLAGAWLPGQQENILRATDLAKRLNIPLVWLVHCSGVKLPEQEKFYADRRGGGTTFFRHAELEQAGVPILAGIWGTTPAGGGYQSISPTILFAHKDANMAVGGGGILSGMFTPTEAAGIAVVYAAMVGAFIYRKLRLKTLPDVLLKAGLESGMVMMLIAMSEPFAWIVAVDQIPQLVIEWLAQLTTSPYIILLLINVFLLILGIPLETAPALVIVTPVLAPIAASLGIDPVHIGVVICLNLVLGLVTPPVGAVLFAVCGISNISMDRLAKAVWKPFVVALIVLAFVTYIPWLTTFLPKRFM